MVRVGIAGLGFMGRTHFTIWEKQSNAKVVALCDTNEKRARGAWADPLGNLPSSWPTQVDMAERKSYTSLDEMLADPEIDVVDITLPTYEHANAVIKALKAGKHVLSEKPMGLNPAECKKVLDAYKKAKSHYMVAQCIRFWPQYVTIRDMIQGKKFGKLRALTLKRLANPPMYSTGNWLMNHRKSGGALLDLHVHDIDYANFVLGKPKAIYAKGVKGPSGGVDHVEAMWDYGKDLIVSVEGGWSFQNSWPFEMAVLARCEKGTIKWLMSEGQEIKVFTDDGVRVFDAFGKEQAGSTSASAPVPTGWDQEIAYFAQKVDAGTKQKEKMCPPESTALSIVLAHAELKSIDSGKTVPVK